MEKVSERVLVVVSGSKSLIGRLIQKLTQSNVSHTFLLYQSVLWGGWWAAQIGPKGVEKLPASKVMKKYSKSEIYEYRGDLSRGLHACRNMVGDSYDFLGIVGFLLKLVVWRLTGRRVKNPLHGKHEEFCSEFVSTVLKNAGVLYFVDCDPASLSPEDVRSLVSSNIRFNKIEEFPV